MNLLVLFDVDGTLIDAGRAGSRAIAAAFLELYGVEKAIEGVSFDGMTDPWIIDRVAELRGLPPFGDGGVERERFFRSYLAHLRLLVDGERAGRVHPGVRQLLDLLSAAGGTALGLATGNIEEGARVKLSPHDLNRCFPVGGFGDDARERPALVRRAVSRAEGHYGRPFAAGQVVVVGDSVHDICAARDGGFRSVAVATGWTSFTDLEGIHPDLLFHDFSEAPAAAAAILGLAGA